MNAVSSELIERYAADGVVALKNVLEKRWLDLLEAGLARNLRRPGPGGGHLSGIESIDRMDEFQGVPGEFWQDSCSFNDIPEFQQVVHESPIVELLAGLMRADKVWLYYDQIFLKVGPARRTPWHQDSPYHLINGPQVATMWIPLTPAKAEEALEFVLGSHRGQMYNGSTFEVGDETTPYYHDEQFPRLPDIEAGRAAWPIKSFSVEPGDVLVFHPNILHGGGPVSEGRQRRTFAVRVFGPDSRYTIRTGQTLPPFPELAEVARDGAFPAHPILPQLWPH